MNNNPKAHNNAIVTTEPESEKWTLLQKQCNAFIASGFLPQHITKGCRTETEAMARAVTIAWKGHELGIPPLQAFSSITVIQGKPCLSAELMLALIYTRCKGAKITFLTPPEKQNTECVVKMQRPDGDPMEFRYTIEDARNAGLQFKSQDGKPTAWAKFPAAMLRARAISAGARAVFPDAIMGCYTPEELGGEVIEAEIPTIIPTKVETIQTTTPPPRNQNTTNHGDWDRAKIGWESDKVSEAQVKRIYAVSKEYGWQMDDVKHLVLNEFDKEHFHDLTKAEVQKLFLYLQDTKTPEIGSDEDLANAMDGN